MSEERLIIQRVVEHYARTGQATDSEVGVTQLPDNKTSFVEPTPDGGRGISLDEYSVDGRTIWAAYSSRTKIVYISDSHRSQA